MMGKQFKRRDFKIKSYVPQLFINEERPLTFRFKPLTNIEIAKYEDLYNKYDFESDNIINAINEIDYLIASKHIVGWDNLIVDGIDEPFNIQLLEEIDIVSVLVELGKYIYLISKTPDLELKMKREP